jgi:hypothetical protein
MNREYEICEFASLPNAGEGKDRPSDSYKVCSVPDMEESVISAWGGAESVKAFRMTTLLALGKRQRRAMVEDVHQ